MSPRCQVFSCLLLVLLSLALIAQAEPLFVPNLPGHDAEPFGFSEHSRGSGHHKCPPGQRADSFGMCRRFFHW